MGRPGRELLNSQLRRLQNDLRIDFTIANIENAASGFGVTKKVYDELTYLAIDAFTGGNHIYDKKDVIPLFETLEKVIRPLNFPPGNPGRGYRIFTVKGRPIAVVNLIGRVFMALSDCPFRGVDAVLPEIQKLTPLIFVDMHAEATSEKIAMGWHLDGRVSAVFGTHTHVMTADQRILDRGTAYATDLGMVGAYDSVLGMERDPIIQKFLTQFPVKFEPVKRPSEVIFNAIMVTVNPDTGKALSIEGVQRRYNL